MLDAKDLDLLERAYASREVQGNIDYVSFCTDINSQNKNQNSRGAEIVMSPEQ